MIKKLMRSTIATAGVASLILLGACSSTSGDSAIVDDQAETRPFTEQGYDPTHSAPELADANNDGHADSSTSNPRNGNVIQTEVITTPAGQSTASVTYTPNPVSTATIDTSSSSSTTYGSSTSSSSSSQSADLTDSTYGSSTDSTTTTTSSMTSSAQSDENAAPVRERLRKD